MSKVFIATEGEYSNYKIVGVFSTKEKAEQFLEFQSHGKYDEWEIEEYEIDIFEPQIKKGLRFFQVVMGKDGNNRTRIENWPDPDSQYQGEREFLNDSYRDYEFGDFRKQVKLIIYTYAKDEQHAVKIANEKRAQYIASGEWDRAEFRLNGELLKKIVQVPK